jgi:excinuclease UvrABC helicase subunit UvrB
VGKKFQLESSFSPMGDQPQAIKTLVDGVNAGEKFQTLLGVTGPINFKTFKALCLINSPLAFKKLNLLPLLLLAPKPMN